MYDLTRRLSRRASLFLRKSSHLLLSSLPFDDPDDPVLFSSRFTSHIPSKSRPTRGERPAHSSLPTLILLLGLHLLLLPLLLTLFWLQLAFCPLTYLLAYLFPNLGEDDNPELNVGEGFGTAKNGDEVSGLRVGFGGAKDRTPRASPGRVRVSSSTEKRLDDRLPSQVHEEPEQDVELDELGTIDRQDAGKLPKSESCRSFGSTGQSLPQRHSMTRLPTLSSRSFDDSLPSSPRPTLNDPTPFALAGSSPMLNHSIPSAAISVPPALSPSVSASSSHMMEMMDVYPAYRGFTPRPSVMRSFSERLRLGELDGSSEGGSAGGGMRRSSSMRGSTKTKRSGKREIVWRELD